MDSQISIGQLAMLAGVSVETIRYYQRRKLLDEPAKPLGGHRRYASTIADRIRFIRRAQELGFALDEIRTLLAFEAPGVCADTHRMALHKLALIERKMADLAAIQRALASLVQQCSQKQDASCPIIDLLKA
jgi:MerR family mercuric resistance operon transcriptional regulator